jgi:hypothetical protein
VLDTAGRADAHGLQPVLVIGPMPGNPEQFLTDPDASVE